MLAVTISTTAIGYFVAILIALIGLSGAWIQLRRTRIEAADHAAALLKGQERIEIQVDGRTSSLIEEVADLRKQLTNMAVEAARVAGAQHAMDNQRIDKATVAAAEVSAGLVANTNAPVPVEVVGEVTISNPTAPPASPPLG